MSVDSFLSLRAAHAPPLRVPMQDDDGCSSTADDASGLLRASSSMEKDADRKESVPLLSGERLLRLLDPNSHPPPEARDLSRPCLLTVSRQPRRQKDVPLRRLSFYRFSARVSTQHGLRDRHTMRKRQQVLFPRKEVSVLRHQTLPPRRITASASRADFSRAIAFRESLFALRTPEAAEALVAIRSLSMRLFLNAIAHCFCPSLPSPPPLQTPCSASNPLCACSFAEMTLGEVMGKHPPEGFRGLPDEERRELFWVLKAQSTEEMAPRDEPSGWFGPPPGQTSQEATMRARPRRISAEERRRRLSSRQSAGNGVPEVSLDSTHDATLHVPSVFQDNPPSLSVPQPPCLPPQTSEHQAPRPCPPPQTSAQQAPPLFPSRPCMYSSPSPYPVWPDELLPAAQAYAQEAQPLFPRGHACSHRPRRCQSGRIIFCRRRRPTRIWRSRLFPRGHASSPRPRRCQSGRIIFCRRRRHTRIWRSRCSRRGLTSSPRPRRCQSGRIIFCRRRRPTRKRRSRCSRRGHACFHPPRRSQSGQIIFCRRRRHTRIRRSRFFLRGHACFHPPRRSQSGQIISCRRRRHTRIRRSRFFLRGHACSHRPRPTQSGRKSPLSVEFFFRGDEKSLKEIKSFLLFFWARCLDYCCSAVFFFVTFGASLHSFSSSCTGLHCLFLMCARLLRSGCYEGPDLATNVLFCFCCFSCCIAVVLCWRHL